MKSHDLLIHLEWDGPYKYSELHELMDDQNDYGVYQIYGTHPIYGSGVLLYIGKSDRQTFGQRISQKGWDYNSDAENLKIYVGRLAGSFTPSNKQWGREIDLVERLLIYSHKPAYNTQSLNSIPDKELQNVHVLNWKHYCDLLPEVSGARWTSKFDYMPEYEVYGNHEKEK